MTQEDAIRQTLSRMDERLRVVKFYESAYVLQAWVRERDLEGWHWDWLQTLSEREAHAWAAALGVPIARVGDPAEAPSTEITPAGNTAPPDEDSRWDGDCG